MALGPNPRSSAAMTVGSNPGATCFIPRGPDKGRKLSRSCFPGLELLISGNRVGGIH